MDYQFRNHTRGAAASNNVVSSLFGADLLRAILQLLKAMYIKRMRRLISVDEQVLDSDQQKLGCQTDANVHIHHSKVFSFLLMRSLSGLSLYDSTLAVQALLLNITSSVHEATCRYYLTPVNRTNI